MNKKTSLLLSILGILSILLVTIGVTYAFFNYAKEGTTENSITTGTITFIYEEIEKNGSGISIENAYPVSDDIGKNKTNAGEVFNFTVKSQTLNETEIPYTITARKKGNSTLDEDAVKLYLTEVNGESETPLTENIYHHLTDYTKAPAGVSEKVLYTDVVPDGSTNYLKNYRLRMWIPSTIDFSPVEDGEGNITYPYNNKTFTVTVNVYANAKVVTVPEEPDVPIAFVPTYFKFGIPTTASSTSFLDVVVESGSNTFVGLGEDGSKGVCIYRNETLECFKNKSYEEEKLHLINVFGEEKCDDKVSSIICTADDNFACGMNSDGYVNCNDSLNNRCDVYDTDYITCIRQ